MNTLAQSLKEQAERCWLQGAAAEHHGRRTREVAARTELLEEAVNKKAMARILAKQAEQACRKQLVNKRQSGNAR